MHIEQRAVIQRCMKRLAKSGQVVAALFCTSPFDGADEFRFEISADCHAAWEVIAKVRFRFKMSGQSEFLNESIAIFGEPMKLLASTYRGTGYKPFMIAVVRISDDAFALHGVRQLMDETASCCINACDSLKWS